MAWRIRALILGLAFIGLCSCGPKEGSLFESRSAKSLGISFENTQTPTEDLNILDYLYFYNGGGVALGDINNDGLVDIFLSGNQTPNALYLNQGNLQFEDISQTAGVQGQSSWNTGATMADVNGDGLLDIYVCAVVGLNGFEGHNELYINQGNGKFSEESANYGLDFDTYASSSVFFDYDGDGDLDLYLLNHAVHTQESYGKASLRMKRNYETGDRLLRNENGHFEDVSEAAGIFGGVNGYGLGISVADFNQDGWPDIYIGNDFHEDDYYYLNQGDGSFREALRENFGHTTRFSMGSDAADINHDGLVDLISLDMLPYNEKVLKSSDGDDNVQTQKMRIEHFGYHYQFTRNMLHPNQGTNGFTETALMSGVAATDWSWSALFSDFDQDGNEDLYISNGIPKRPNDLDFIRFVSSDQIKKKINNTKLVDQKALEMMPSGLAINQIFQGDGKLHFKERTDWVGRDSTVSGATAFGDLDNDGDLDLVINNLNAPPSILINTTNAQGNHLKLSPRFKDKNPFGLGTKVYAFHKGDMWFKELYPNRGFQASSEPMLHFGLGTIEELDSVRIIWPDHSYQTLTAVKTNQHLRISPEDTHPWNYASTESKNTLFTQVKDQLGLNFQHEEDNYTDFNRQKLIPYQISDRGPAVALGDLNHDGLTDVFFGGSKRKRSQTFLQTESGFVRSDFTTLTQDSIKEDVAAHIADFNGDGKQDILVGSGGGDYYRQMKPLTDSYFVSENAGFALSELPESFQNASVIAPFDFDADGDLDVFIGNQAITNDFGRMPSCQLLNNDNGRFEEIPLPEGNQIGMVTDAVWSDFDADGTEDLIIVGEWMAPLFFKNNGGVLEKVNPLSDNPIGLWQSLVPFDMDQDGDTDYMIGNWGLNSKFTASEKYPLRMYYADFDDNGQTETIVATAKDKNYYPLLSFDELSSQLVSLKKEYTSYKSFGGTSMEALLKKIAPASKPQVFEVSELRSGYLKNENGRFEFVAFDDPMQIAPIMDFCIYDFDQDGTLEVLAAGNYFGVTPLHGRLDGFSGALIEPDGKIRESHTLGLDLKNVSVRHLNLLPVNEKQFLLVTLNNAKAQIYQLK